MSRRIEKLQAALERLRLGCAILLQNRDIYYFTGTMQDGALVVPASGEPVLLVRRNYERAQQEATVPSLRRMDSLDEMREIVPQGMARAGMEADVLPVATYQRLVRLFPGTEWVDISGAIMELRMVKEPGELELISRSAAINDAAHRRAAEVLRDGLTEVELFSEMEYAARRLGDDRLGSSRGFNTLPPCQIGSGEGATMPNRAMLPFGGVGISPAAPCGPSARTIRRGEAVVVDWVSSFNGYISDQTRTYFIGPPDGELLRAYETCRSIYHAVVAAMAPGVPGKQLYELAVKMAAEAGYEHFLGLGEYRVRFVGHGVGLELTEQPVLSYREDRPLPADCVLTVEPKIVLPGKGAVGIENTLWLSRDGPRPLTSAPEMVIL
ncbi:MAG: Xaa-Pro peptidase family protein [Chloroflexota bacterium]